MAELILLKVTKVGFWQKRNRRYQGGYQKGTAVFRWTNDDGTSHDFTLHEEDRVVIP